MRDPFKEEPPDLSQINEVRGRVRGPEPLITDQKRAEEALRASEMRFRSVAESAIDAIILSSSEDRILFWNKGAQKIFGYSEKEVLGRPVTMLIPERYKDAHRNGVSRYLRTGEPVHIGKTMELHGLRKDGSEFPLELSLSTWRTREGTFFAGIIRDISRRKEAEQALEHRTAEARQRTAELESLIQMVAHDLKSPVITIAGLVRLLNDSMRKQPPNQRRDQILNQLRTASETVEKFLGDLLDGLAPQPCEPERMPVRLDEAIEEVVAQHKQTIQERGINVRVEIRPSRPVILGDTHRIKQVVDNLLNNAIRHMGAKSDPVIEVQVIEDDDFFITRVSDNGIGIAREFQSKIFDRFFRIPIPGMHGGTGLGLSIVKKIVESHGGDIWVESEEGRGATFAFALPKRVGSG